MCIPKSVSTPILKVEPTKLVHDQNVPRAEVQVTLTKDVFKNLFLGGLGIPVALKVLYWQI